MHKVMPHRAIATNTTHHCPQWRYENCFLPKNYKGQIVGAQRIWHLLLWRSTACRFERWPLWLWRRAKNAPAYTKNKKNHLLFDQIQHTLWRPRRKRWRKGCTVLPMLRLSLGDMARIVGFGLTIDILPMDTAYIVQDYSVLDKTPNTQCSTRH